MLPLSEDYVNANLFVAYSCLKALAGLCPVTTRFSETCSKGRRPPRRPRSFFSVEIIQMIKPTFFRILFALFTLVALIGAPKPAFAQRGGGGHGGGGGGGGGRRVPRPGRGGGGESGGYRGGCPLGAHPAPVLHCAAATSPHSPRRG